MIEYLFWCASVLAIFSYVVYPILLKIFAKTNIISSQLNGTWPKLSIIIAAHNEERRIAAKLSDTLERCQEYAGETEIIVVSDASSDGTEEEVATFSSRGVRCLRQDARNGKEAAQKLAIASADGAVLVFTDASTGIGDGSLTKIAELLSQDSIGVVSSEDRFVADGKIVGEGLYVKYEMALRRLESKCAGLVGVSGSLFAARRDVCNGWIVNVPSDLMVATLSAKKGLRTVSSREVIGIYADVKNSDDEFNRKTRTIIRGMAGLAESFKILSARENPGFVLQLIGHKVMRWAVPWMLALAFITSACLAYSSVLYLLLFGIQVVVYLVMTTAIVAPALCRNSLVRICYYFGQVNVAAAVALVSYLRGKRLVTWEPSKR